MMTTMEQQESLIKQTLLSQQELQSIHINVNIRRGENFIKTKLLELQQGQFFTKEMKEYHERSIALVEQKMSGVIDAEIVSPRDASDQIKDLLDRAENVGDSRLTSFYYAKAAEAQASLGFDFADTLSAAKKFLEDRNQKGIMFVAPADLLPDAIIIGIEKRMISSSPTIPSAQKIARAFAHNPSDKKLLADCIELFSKDEVSRLGNGLPEKERMIFDKTLIEILTEDKVYNDKIKRYLSDETNIPFLKKLIVENPDSVDMVFNVLISQPDFSLSKSGTQLLDNLEQTHLLLETGDFADLCQKALSSSAILLSAEKFEKELKKVVKTNLQEAVKQKNTQGLIDILDKTPSDYVLSQIGVERLMKSLLGEMIEGKYVERNIKTFVDWINRMKSQQREDEFSRIIHSLGGKDGSEGNSQVQAFLFSLFILPAQEKLGTAQKVKFQRSDLFQAGKTVIDALSQKKTDIGVRFQKEKKHLEDVIVDEYALPNDNSGYSTEMEVFYLDEHQRQGYGFEFITPIREDIGKAFRIASAFVELNEALKDAGLLWPPAGHSIHTHVSEFVLSSHTEEMRGLFDALSTICFLSINPVDREEYILKHRGQNLISIDSLDSGLCKLQNRQGMILDRLSFNIVKDLTRYAEKIFVHTLHGVTAEQHIKQTVAAIVNDIKTYIGDEIKIIGDKKSLNQQINSLDEIKTWYDLLSYGALSNHEKDQMIGLLESQLNQAQTAEARTKAELQDMTKRRRDGDKTITKNMLEAKVREAREASEGKINIDYFFLLGKRSRDECALLIHMKLMERMSSFSRNSS